MDAIVKWSMLFVVDIKGAGDEVPS